MQIISEKINKISLEFIQDIDNGVDDISPLVTSLYKFKKIINEPGFKNDFSRGEKELWNQIFSNILEDSEKPSGMSSMNNIVSSGN